MLSNVPIHAVLAASDLQRARRWYAEKLGLNPTRVEEGELIYRLGGATLMVYETPSAGSARNTVAQWDVENLDAVMADLRERGVVFEDYDYPGLATVNGVADVGDARMAWFKDSEGNILALHEMR